MKIKTQQSYLDSLEFHMLPQDGGQIVDVMYATDQDGVWRQIIDGSDGSVSYQFAKYYARAKEESLVFEPHNGTIPRHNKWLTVSIEKSK